jgi:hypothetical protein
MKTAFQWEEQLNSPDLKCPLPVTLSLDNLRLHDLLTEEEHRHVQPILEGEQLQMILHHILPEKVHNSGADICIVLKILHTEDENLKQSETVKGEKQRSKLRTRAFHCRGVVHLSQILLNMWVVKRTLLL